MTGHLTAEWCRVAPGHSKWTGELSAVGEHNSSGVCCPIRDHWCKSAMAIEMLHSHQKAVPVAYLPLDSLCVLSFRLQANTLFFISNPDCPECYLLVIRFNH